MIFYIGTCIAPITIAKFVEVKGRLSDNAGTHMKDRIDKRRHRRLRLQYDISCRKVSSTGGKSYRGRTVNVSSGGLYFETTVEVFRRGDVLKVILEIPPTAGLLEFGGKLAGYANVLRAERIRDTDPPCDNYGVAAQFCRSPKLCL